MIKTKHFQRKRFFSPSAIFIGMAVGLVLSFHSIYQTTVEPSETEQPVQMVQTMHYNKYGHFGSVNTLVEQDSNSTGLLSLSV